MTPDELKGIAERIMELGRGKPGLGDEDHPTMDEDQQTEMIDLGFTLASWIASDETRILMEEGAFFE